MPIKKSLITAVCMLMLATVAEAQPKCNSSREKHDNFEQIHNAKVAFFTSQLELSTEEAEKFWPAYNKYWETRSKEHKAGMELFRRISDAAASGQMSDVEMKGLMLEWQSHIKKENDIENLYLEEFYKILPVRKVLKIYVAEEDFRMKMIEIWKKPQQKKENND